MTRQVASQLFLGVHCLLLFHGNANAGDWLQFRGPGGTGSVEANLPVEISPEKNLSWSVELPGKGVSSPVVVHGRVVVTCSSGARGERMTVASYDVGTGKEVWERNFWATGRPYCHPTSANAAPSPCSDGERIYAFFSSNDLACLDLEGNLLWFRGLTFDSPQAANDVGMSSSPVIAGDMVIVQVENQGDSFVMALDRKTGETRWKSPRPRDASWASPVVFEEPSAKRTLVLVQGRDGLAAINVADGKEAWRTDKECNVIPSASVAGDVIYAPLNGLTALRTSGGEDFEVLWEESKLGPGSASFVIHGDRIYVLNRAGVLNAAELKSGKQLWQSRVGGQYWASPVAAGHHLYCFDADGVARVVDLDAEGKVVHTHEFGEPILGTPAIADGALFVRGDKHLWKFSGGAPSTARR